jgi:hypothetical protein
MRQCFGIDNSYGSWLGLTILTEWWDFTSAEEERPARTDDTLRRRNKLIHPMIHNKQVIIDSSVLRIMRVSSQMVAF